MTFIPGADWLEAVDERHLIFTDRLMDPLAFEGGKFHFSAKDNQCARDFQARAGSQILKGYRPPFDATPIKRLREEGGILLGKTNMDEFGFGSFSTTSAFGIPRKPIRCREVLRRLVRGVRPQPPCLIPDHIALGVSTGVPSPVSPRSAGVVGLTPPMGASSPLGADRLWVNSLDKVGLNLPDR
jgi:aspartyl-tRNA(Asn)/glutamyl-tRNA(Gln) amidotransferase subunit A